MPAAPFLLWLHWQIAAEMGTYMNQSVDPCTDFYQFACGNFKNRYQLKDYESSFNAFRIGSEAVQSELKEILEENTQKTDPPSTVMTKNFFKSCMDVQMLEKLGLEPLQNLLKKFGGLPVVEGSKWKDDQFSWMELNAKIDTIGQGGFQFLTFYIDIDIKNSSKSILTISQASLGLEREFLINPDYREYVDAYLAFLVSSAVQLGAEKNLAKKEMEEVLNLQNDLAHAIVKQEELRDALDTYHPITIKDLKLKYPKIDFDTWFKTASSETGFNLKDSERVNVAVESFLEKLPGILAKYSKRTLANYQLSGLFFYFTHLAPGVQGNYDRFNQKLSGTKQQEPRWKKCIRTTQKAMRFPLASMYVKKHFSEKDKIETNDLFTNVRKAMKINIDNIPWMDSKTRTNAQKKLKNMRQEVAFPSPDIYNETWLMQYYLMAQINELTYFDNIVSLRLSVARKAYNEYFLPINQTEWTTSITSVNAYYYPNYNKFGFPAAILRPPFYYSGGPDYVNYGRIGEVIGHEITHGFDDQGSQYDYKGNENQWWSNSTLAEFKKRAKCFIDQYGSIVEPTTNLSLNGINTQGENIADNGGVKMAFKGYKLAMQSEISKNHPKNNVLPGFKDYSQDQLFYIAFAQSSCSLQRLEVLKEQIVTGNHSPGVYRVNAVLQNNREFATAFKCPIESPMNPSKKCEIW